MERVSKKLRETLGLPRIADLAAEIKDYADYLRDNYSAEDEPCGDFRLQCHDGWWTPHRGDSSYDQDHRGYWGAACVSPGQPLHSCLKTAWELIDEVIEDFAQTSEGKEFFKEVESKKYPEHLCDVATWFERDRQHVHLFCGDENTTILEWWDGAVTEAVEDGILKPGYYKSSAIAYAKHLGLIV